MYWAGAHIPALDAVCIPVGFGGQVVSHGLSTKAQVTVQPGAQQERHLRVSLCLCPQGLLSQRQQLARVLSISIAPSSQFFPQ